MFIQFFIKTLNIKSIFSKFFYNNKGKATILEEKIINTTKEKVNDNKQKILKVD